MARTIQTNPSVILAEKRVLNALFHRPELLDEVDPAGLLYGTSVSLAKAMARMKNNGIPFSKMTLLQAASDVDLNVDEDLLTYIISDDVEEDVSDALRVISKGRRRLEVKKSLAKLIDVIDGMAVEDPEAEASVRNEIESALLEFSGEDDETKGMYGMAEWLDEFDEDRRRARHGIQHPFNNFIFDSLVPDGAEPGTFGIVAGASGSGKSTVALKLVRSLIASDVPCLYFSLEMTKKQTAGRLVSAEIQVPYFDVMRSTDPTEFEIISKKILRAREELDAKVRFKICEDADLSLGEMERHVRKFQEAIGQKYCVVVVDLLSIVKEFAVSKGNMNYADSVTGATNELNSLVKRLGIHAVGIVQLNRSAESERANTWEDLRKFEPQRSHIKSAGAYVERGRYILGIHRPMFWAVNCNIPEAEYIDQMDECIISVLKINNGETGKRISSIFDAEVFDVLPISTGSTFTSDD